MNYNLPMQEQDHLVVLFADISQGTRLYEAIGTESARAIVARGLGVLSEVTDAVAVKW
jgi:class 3 adenylate cyclase